MNLVIISKNYGNQSIDTNTFDELSVSRFSTIYRGMYESEYDQPPIYGKVGAIRDGISILVQEAIELGKSVITTKDIIKFDIECAFE